MPLTEFDTPVNSNYVASSQREKQRVQEEKSNSNSTEDRNAT
jgi:hypothetical protein